MASGVLPPENLVSEHALTKVLDQRKPVAPVEEFGRRRRKTVPGKLRTDGNEWLDIFGQVGDRTVGQTVADRRAIGLPGRIHQQKRRQPVVLGHADPGITAGGCVALQVLDLNITGHDGAGSRPFADELPHGPCPRQAVPDWAFRRNRDLAPGRACIVLFRNFNSDALFHPDKVGTFRPFDKHEGLRCGVIDAQLIDVVDGIQAIEIVMVHRIARQVIDLLDGVGRARYFEIWIGCDRTYQFAGQGGLAHAEFAAELDNIAGTQLQCQDLREEAALRQCVDLQLPLERSHLKAANIRSLSASRPQVSEITMRFHFSRITALDISQLRGSRRPRAQYSRSVRAVG